MISRLWGLVIAVSMLTPVCWADDSPASSDTSAQENKSDSKQAESPQNLCVRECTRSSARCSADVQRARSQCSRTAAVEGDDPMRSNRDVEVFCGYFRKATACDSNHADKHCVDRFRSHYNQCLAAVRPNVMSSRYDCFQEERQAEGMCRSELNECKQACYQ
jgi:hypothetical protein